MNRPFFTCLENAFIVAHERFGKERALAFMKALMERNLREAYDREGFRKGSPEDFARLMERRDRSVGLDVELEVGKGRIRYAFLTPLFDKWKGLLTAEEAVATFMDFKVSYLLGEEWKWRLTKHFWWGDDRIEVVIEKVKAQPTTPPSTL